MMNKKPEPLYFRPHPGRKRCPVCGSVSYSTSGIHPQCAVRQADVERMNEIKALALNTAPKAPPAHQVLGKDLPEM